MKNTTATVLLTLLFVILTTMFSTGCAGVKWSDIGAGRTPGVDQLPAGSIPASKLPPMQPYSYSLRERWNGKGEVEMKGTYVWVEIHPDGTHRVVERPYGYSYKYEYVPYSNIGVVTDPNGPKAQTVYGNPRIPFRR